MEGKWAEITGGWYWYTTKHEANGFKYTQRVADLWRSKAGKTERWRYRIRDGATNPFGTLLPVDMTLEEAKQFIEVLVRMS